MNEASLSDYAKEKRLEEIYYFVPNPRCRIGNPPIGGTGFYARVIEWGWHSHPPLLLWRPWSRGVISLDDAKRRRLTSPAISSLAINTARTSSANPLQIGKSIPKIRSSQTAGGDLVSMFPFYEAVKGFSVARQGHPILLLPERCGTPSMLDKCSF